MDLATLLGLFGAFAVLIAAIMAGGDFMLFVDVPSILIVFGASTLIVCSKYTVHQITKAFGIAAKAFFAKQNKPDELIELCYKLADEAKKGGILALEKIQIDNPFLKRGVAMSVDGIKPEIIKANLTTEKNEMLARHEQGQSIFKALADVAPAIGMLGTLIGLVQMLSNMTDPDSVGPAMAVALITTFYGAMIAFMIAGPIADKLALRSGEEELCCNIVIDAVAAINEGINARVVRDSLFNYLPPSQRPVDQEAA